MIYKSLADFKVTDGLDLFDDPLVATNGKIHDLNALSGFVALKEGSVKGAITFIIENGECEIVSLDSWEENQGIGSALIRIVIDYAKENGCKRVWLVTTNENIRGIRFYQKRGFDMKTINRNAVNAARKLKPTIPLYSDDGIPIKHEIAFELLLEEENV